MEANPRLGILQTLVVGLPARSAFARIFQFGMRHGMRTHTLGAAWWQGDAGPYWGHNAIIRLAPFIRHCALPVLSGKGPLSGPLLSHDQVEAVLMRRAGYDVRVLPEETDSFEENPPTLPEFLKRDLRWCHGNLQYLKLLGLPNITAMGRLQLVLAILMYTASPVWLGFMMVGLAQIAWPGGAGAISAQSLPAMSPASASGALDLALVLFAAVLAMSLAPKLLGVLDVALQPAVRRRYGGGGRLLVGAALETCFGILLAPVVAVAQTIFIAGLSRGRTRSWAAQNRTGRALPLASAARGFWPQAVLGVGAAVLLAVQAPAVLPWAAPVLAGWLLAIPLAWATSRPALGSMLEQARICAVPEELLPQQPLAKAA
jgi:membrane glycosyltransferase